MNFSPSHFCDYPWDSVLKQTEAEIVAMNIMKIRRRLGNRWELSWQDYERERRKDGNFNPIEQHYFEQVIPLIPDAIGAIAFSTSWANSARDQES